MKNAVDKGVLGKIHCIKTTTRDSPKPSYTFLKAAGNDDSVLSITVKDGQFRDITHVVCT